MSNTTNVLPKDSGSRREFSTGAHRDAASGKGRCDLLPLKEVAFAMNDPVISEIAKFTEDFNQQHLANALQEASKRLNVYGSMANMMLEVSILYEAGAIKYGENNWQKGIPTHCYIDSAIRHYLKYLRGDKDEPHNRAFVWNLICCIWTCMNKPELNDYAKRNEEE